MWWRDTPGARFRRAKYADYFACLDRDENGVLGRNDFATYTAAIADQLGIDAGSPSLDRLRAATDALWDRLAAADDDGDGRVDLDELVGALFDAGRELETTGAVPAWAIQHAEASFRLLDADGDGAIRPDEYAAYLRALGSDADPVEAFQRLDVQGAGALPASTIERLYADWLGASDEGAPGNVLLTGRLPPD